MTSQFTVGLVTKGKADRVVVDADDALIAALKVKTERPEATITYVRRQNRRGDARHPAHALRAPLTPELGEERGRPWAAPEPV